ncbi:MULTISPECIES: response regulator [unclassified Paenibacillus]|uniref:response regulator n=1 Tax=unclassified Paenibacillus TaxID=185978 RepID=UPI002405113B|nr:MULTISPECIES: response regulator [unclassified Paenibacillus]MDF9841215.1 two-component system response regulator YesN [Paenibacillus sp. PastF-2]MDF9847613.1 two-component system response regulator YesN [Paenibacillus sp. PastM-2]MDF9854182.1 two-component system response regulator YesN [Paenibacillus sp. PastF-1]MDH6479647.1 two-component system response regulator YesN [Paenibacillus sp. PastH-2]MDH6505312.1 two-component system response regulator YesN [Paenibacillus sp. PastM-3]
MNILIADDERVIREGIMRTIKHLYPDYEVYVAERAEEAVRLMEEQHIHIVLTDILMPGMSGLEFMKITRRRFPYVKWVVISAHSEFAYAQEAVRLGARDYLLKPIGKSKLQEIISSLTEEIQQDSDLSRQGERLRASLRFLREGVFQRLASGLDIGNLDLSPFIADYSSYYLLMVQLEPGEGGVRLEHFIVENVLSELVERHGRGFVVSYDRRSLLGLITLEEHAQIGQFRAEVQEHLSHYLKIPFQLLHSGLSHDFSSVPQVVKRLREASASQAFELEPVKGSGEKAVEVALHYIREHYAEDLSLERMASVVFLNPAYFSQLFKQKTGQGYKEYVTSLRLEQAKLLLLNPKLKLAEIAERVGYQDMKHFTQMFRKRTGLTPTEYRQQANINIQLSKGTPPQ